jgi:cobalt-zinc-cadmium efflux system protein
MSDHHHGHDHDHDHGHGHSHDHKGYGPAFGLALGITAGYAVVELVGGLWTGSLALLSDAGHMFSDALSLGLAAIAAHLAQRPVGHRHTYGWARAEVIGALVNSLLMLAIIFVLVAEAVARLRAPAPVAAGGMIVIALIGMAVNVAVAWTMSRGEMTLGARAVLLHVLGDLISSFAAVVAGAVIYATGWLPIDPILSLVIAGLILVSTLRLLRDTVHVLMEGVPPALDLPAIGRNLAGVPGVISVHDLHVWSIASDRAALSAHIELEDIRQWPEILTAAGELLRKHYGIEHVTLQPEVRAPDAGRTSVIRLWPRGHRPRN